MPDGLATPLRGDRIRSVREWLGEGGEREDDGSPWSGRFHNHFHNPLRPWAEAGLHATGHTPSLVHWMQHQNEGAGDNWAWRNARQFYLEALTAGDARAREEAAADLFRALGQIMHLVVDASVPEHVRDDPHPFGTVSRRLLRRVRAGNYEYWVSDQHARQNPQQTAEAEGHFVARYLSNPIGFDSRILRLPPPPGEMIATVPIARLIDTDIYTAAAPDPNLTLSGFIGLAEFTNANFFSEDTLLGRFPFPRRDGLTPNPRVAPRSPRVRAYFAKPAGQGQPTAVALAECVSERRVGRWVVGSSSPYPCVDEAVWEETATHTLPRAVGYARGVLDYFFRGSVRVLRVAATPTGLRIQLQNTSAERMEGVFEVYARRDKGSPEERRDRSSMLNGGGMIALDPGRIADLPLSLAPGDPTPYHVLVFRGRLGEEENAVVGQVFALPHVQIVQHAYDADISRTCTSQRFSPTFIVPLREVLSCSWQPINHRLEGSLVTNFADSAAANLLDPAIERIEAFWTGSLGGPAPLTVNGVRYAMGVWQRQGNEPNPERFGIADPAQRRDSRLTLTVFLRGGERFSTQLATFKGVVTAAEKAVRTVFLGTTAERWLVVSRTTRVEPNVDGSSFSLVSIGGYPVPTPLRLGEQLAFNLWRDALEVTSLSGFQNLVDVFERFPFAPATAYETRWAEIALDPPFPQAPELHWSAMVRPRAPQPGALQFWQAFVASGDPPLTAIALTGHQPAAP